MQKASMNPSELWKCDNALIVETDEGLTEVEVLQRMTKAVHERVGELALVDCHRIGPTKYRVVVYARQGIAE